MELTGDLLIGAPPEKVWQALNDPEVLAKCIPGCEEITKVSDTEMQARTKIKIGPVQARFSGRILLSDIQPGQGCTISFDGTGGAAGFAKGSSVVTLQPEADGTRLAYSSKATVGGKLGQIGSRLIDASARHMADQFFTALQEQLGGVPESAQAAVHEKPVEPGVNGEQAAPPVTPAAAPAIQSLPSTPLPASPPPLASTPEAQAPSAPVAPAIASSPPLPQAAPRPAVTPVAARPEPPPPQPTTEQIRILWFLLGAASTAFGFWIAHLLAR
ncbi:CoxG family protein [Noviherbaspirillum galbum]|uniref:CoxG family protein n=1 Tax=Noviherbaspirillum galbum TaxID=2709383 RepID=UPI001969C5EE|nr:carbon monoxide dehydrogenase subunit G [Noviherbaspirillum galbum]